MRPEGERLGVVVYIVVDHIEATLERVAELGGRVTSSKIALGAGYGAYFEDPAGNLLGLYEDRKVD